MNREVNPHTQPFVAHPVFNNWDVVAEGWYIALRSRALRRGQATSVKVCGQQIAVFRGEDGKVRALDAFCPHMGTDLGIGKVQDNTLRCFFHHWRFDETGACVDVPCGEPIPKNARLHAWPTCERFGFIWVFAGERATTEGPVVPAALEGLPLVVKHGRAFTRGCHHHVNMVNGLDPQHLSTVHGIRLGIDCESVENDEERRIDFVLNGQVPADTPRARLARFFLGDRYGYAIRYGHANVGALTVVKDTFLFGRYRLPEIYTVWAYRVLEPGKSEVQPIYLTRRRPGLVGLVWSWLLVWLSWLMYMVLRDEDGAVYDNMRFSPRNLLKVDAPVARYIGYVNRLPPSPWSRSWRPALAQEGPTRLKVVPTEEETEGGARTAEGAVP